MIRISVNIRDNMGILLYLIVKYFHCQGEGYGRPLIRRAFQPDLPVPDFDGSASDDEAKTHQETCALVGSHALIRINCFLDPIGKCRWRRRALLWERGYFSYNCTLRSVGGG